MVKKVISPQTVRPSSLEHLRLIHPPRRITLHLIPLRLLLDLAAIIVKKRVTTQPTVLASKVVVLVVVEEVVSVVAEAVAVHLMQPAINAINQDIIPKTAHLTHLPLRHPLQVRHLQVIRLVEAVERLQPRSVTPARMVMPLRRNEADPERNRDLKSHNFICHDMRV